MEVPRKIAGMRLTCLSEVKFWYLRHCLHSTDRVFLSKLTLGDPVGLLPMVGLISKTRLAFKTLFGAKIGAHIFAIEPGGPSLDFGAKQAIAVAF